MPITLDGKKNKESNFPSGRFVTCLAEGAELRGEGWGSQEGTQRPPPHHQLDSGSSKPVRRNFCAQGCPHALEGPSIPAQGSLEGQNLQFPISPGVQPKQHPLQHHGVSDSSSPGEGTQAQG